MSKFNVGDRVEYIGAEGWCFEECLVKTGVVAYVDKKTPDVLLIHFDDVKFRGHNGNNISHYNDFRCWWFTDTQLKLLDEISEISEDVISEPNKQENKHYSSSKIQPIEYIQSIFKDNKNLTPFESACIKDIIKYTGRYGKKDEKLKEAGKILDYALWLYLSANGIDINPRVHTHKEIMDKVVNQ